MVNTYKLKLTTLQQEIMRLLFAKAGTKLNQRQIAKSLEVSQPAVMKSLPRLQKMGMIKKEQDKETKRWSIEMNRDNPNIIQMKRTDNLRRLYESGLVDLLEESLPGSAIIVFGSYSRGEDLSGSDIDIAVIGRKEKNLDLTEFEKHFERKISIMFETNAENLNPEIANSLINGIVISGYFSVM